MTTDRSAATFPHTATLLGRLSARIERRGPDECWPWTGGLFSAGYGRMSVNNRSRPTTRLLWQIVHGPIPPGYLICHHCDNRRCMNMRHWFLGTQLDNARDKVSKGRMPSFAGERNGYAKLTADDVRAIRSAATSGMFHADIAADFGVSASCVRAVVSGERWSHVQ